MKERPMWAKGKEWDGWERCECPDQPCLSILRECVHGTITVTPGMFGCSVRVTDARRSEVTPLPKLAMAIELAEREALAHGGWLTEVGK